MYFKETQIEFNVTSEKVLLYIQSTNHMRPTNLAQESPLDVFPDSCVTQHPSLLSTGYDTGQSDIQQENNLCLSVCVSEYLKNIKKQEKVPMYL